MARGSRDGTRAADAAHRRRADDAPPVTIKRRRVACKNKVYVAYFDHVIDHRTGADVEDYLVVRPRHSGGDMVTGVSVLPIFQGAVMLLRSYRYPIARWVLEIPRGFLDKNESPRKAALRELREETGLTCAAAALMPLGYCAPEAGLLAGRVALFAALQCRRMEKKHDHAEVGLGLLQAVSLDKARTLMSRMTIEDPTTALALHRYFLKISERLSTKPTAV